MQAIIHPVVDAFINRHSTVDWSEPIINIEIPIPHDLTEATNWFVHFLLTVASFFALHFNQHDIELLASDIVEKARDVSQTILVNGPISKVRPVIDIIVELLTPESDLRCDILDQV